MPPGFVQGLPGSEIGHPCLLVFASHRPTWICHGRDQHSTWTNSRLLVHMISNPCSASEVTSLGRRFSGHMDWPYRSSTAESETDQGRTGRVGVCCHDL